MNGYNPYTENGGMEGFEDYVRDSVTSEKQLPVIVTNRDMVVGALQMAAAAGELMDIVKRFVIYQKPFTASAYTACAATIIDLERAMMRIYNASTVESAGQSVHREVTVNTRLLHSTIGLFGEVGELAEAMLKQARGQTLDAVNVGEEIGDLFWYLAIAIDELGEQTKLDAGEWLYRNRQKLIARMKNGTVTTKEGRDIDGERSVLEGECARVEDANA